MRFELMTSSLPRRRSTPELRGRSVAQAVSLLPSHCSTKQADSLFYKIDWSGRRDSNSRPSAWKADALPTELHPPISRMKEEGGRMRVGTRAPRSSFILPTSSLLWCRGQDSNLRKALACRVYSPVPLTTRPPLHALSNGCWSRRRDLNPRPSDYKSDALPTELRRHATERNSAFRQNSDTNNRSLKRQAAG